MKILMLSADDNAFNQNSAVRSRLIEYSNLFDDLRVLIYTRRPDLVAQERISDRLALYPIRAIFKPAYFWQVFIAASKVLRSDGDWRLTSQDPFETGLAGALLSWWHKIPLQIQIHTDFLSPFYKSESLKNRIRVAAAKIIIRRANGIRVVSERIKNSILKLYPTIRPEKISVVSIAVDPNGMRGKKIRTNLRQKYSGYDFIALIASRFTVEKNISMAVQAWSDMVKKHPRSLLLLVGSGPEHQNLKVKIKNLKLEKNVVIEPWTDDLSSYYKTADVFLLTSNYEGGARSPAEALSVGLPVIMTDVAPANEFVMNDKNGFVVPVGDSAALAGKLNQFREMNPAERAVFSRQGMMTSDNFRSKEQYLLDYQASLKITLDPIFNDSI